MKCGYKNGKFIKNVEEGLNLSLPFIKQIIQWALIIFILFPWIIIGAKLNILKKISVILESIMSNSEENETQKKNGLFY